MSLVERALKKLQDSRSPARSASAPSPEDLIIGSVISAPARPKSETEHARARTDKLIAIDRQALRGAGLLPTEQHERRLASEYRKIKRPIVAAALGRDAPALPNAHSIMVASALPGEGKTFTSINLALSLALEKDLSVLLVDADTPKPHISRIFGVENEPGLLDLLVDETRDIASVIIPTDIPRLSILPVGRRTEVATELLASERMYTIAASLASAEGGRLVVFDSPPLLLTSESLALAAIVGQIAIVVRAGATLRSAVSSAVALLGENAENKNVGFILNQSEFDSPNTYYGYGDYYNTGKAQGESA